MKNTRAVCTAVIALAWLALTPAILRAQTGTIAGSVKDTTGAVLPGVTVEAASPALIERVRTVVTDGEGLYKIADLRPGAYTITFTLTGFSNVRREGIELSAGFTATVNADLRVGTVEETITVSGASPLVDVQNTRQQTVVNRDVMDTIPTGRNPAAFAVLVPGVVAAGSSGLTGQDMGGSTADRTVYLIVHGSRGQASPLLYDGMRYNNMNGTPGGGHVIWASNNAVGAGIHGRSRRVCRSRPKRRESGRMPSPNRVATSSTGWCSPTSRTRACSPPAMWRIRRSPRPCRRTGTSTRRSVVRSKRTSYGSTGRTATGAFMSIRPAPITIPICSTGSTSRTSAGRPSTRRRTRASTHG